MESQEGVGANASSVPGEIGQMQEKLSRVSRWINRFPVPTNGATAMMCHLRDVSEELGRLCAAAAPADAPADKIEAAIKWLNSASHGDNCFVSDHYEGDPGNRCNCGKDSLLEFLESGSADAPRQAADAKDAARYRFLRNQQSWGNVIYEAIGYGGGEDFDKAIDATMGFTPQELSPALHSDEELRKTEGYRLGYMEGVAEGAPPAASGVAAQAADEPDCTFDHLAGRGLHELRTDELPAYLSAVAHNHGARSEEFATAAQWVSSEIERKTNDERVLAVKLATLKEGAAPNTAARW
jgi:hypothetical protein